MQTPQLADQTGTVAMPTTAIILILLASLVVLAQGATYPPRKPSPAKIEPQIVVLPESVTRDQWTHTLNLVNAPQTIAVLNPGECIKVGVYSTGDNRDEFLERTKLSFRVEFARRNELHPLEPLAAFKKIKPEGGDFVAAALSAAGVKQPESTKTMASLGVSADRWCVPPDAGDGTATVEAEVESPGGHQRLRSSTLQVESFDAGSKKAFRDSAEVGTFLQTYYRQPEPARLLPALQFEAADQTQNPRRGQIEIFTAFLSTALKCSISGAQDFKTRVSAQPPIIRALGLLSLRAAGYDVKGVLDTMSKEDQEKFSAVSPLQDPFDFTATPDLFQHLDMLWAVFGATGELKPVQAVASALSWKQDYDDFDKLRKTPNHPSTLTPSIIRGVTYTAAGWSLRSLQQSDPLVADYIDYLLSSSDTPESVRVGLRGLRTDPAFKQAGGQ